MEAPGPRPPPLGGPEPLAEEEDGSGLRGMMTIVLVASGTLLFIGVGLPMRTQGASRSARLRREQQQRAAVEAVAAIEAERAAEASGESGGE
jgi:hypothetical protein